MILQVVGGVMLVVGALLAVIAGLGLHRFPDVFARMHAATKATTLGMVLVLTGAALQMTGLGDAFKMMLVIVPQLITAPVGAHMIARAAYRSGTELSDKTAIDELAEHTDGR